ncbi:MAG: FAD:protein FMN transferase [Acidimicrobiaceae bacterium]|nr:FAD:protein FMN transferase [Acidimicrobiaceae bacterium]MBO0747919.1 FAD:protein FMN transferase [Acidimicrobiaceae bacterium]
MNAFRHAETVMGTVVSFELRSERADAGAAGSAAEAVAEAVTWLHWVDETFSTYKTTSEISRLDAGELTIEDCHPEVRHILSVCEELRRDTAGYFDARAGGRLDPSGVVKGWSIEGASEILVALGWPDHLVDGGGDVRVHGRPGQPGGWRLGITHPFRRDALCAVVHLDEGAVATSGTYERGLHVIDPHRRRPATDLSAVTVVGPELVRTDAYATAALAMGITAAAWLTSLDGYEGLVIDAVGRPVETPGFANYRVETRVASSA